MNSELINIINNFTDQRILVIGDIMLDRYVFGRVKGISPEAPVPIVDYTHEELKPGGAANVALNINKLGARADLIGICGEDRNGNILLSSIENNGLFVPYIIRSQERKTTSKTRIIAESQHLLRFDDEDRHELSSQELATFESVIDKLDWGVYDAIILQDYNKGLLNESSIKTVLKKANKEGISVVVDPKVENSRHFEKVLIFKPNLFEVSNILKREVTLNKEDLLKAAEELRTMLDAKTIMITLGSQGIFILGPNGSDWCRTKSREVIDVCGAGDAVIAVSCLSLKAKPSNIDLAMLGNMAGGICCESLGVYSPNQKELFTECKKLDF